MAETSPSRTHRVETVDFLRGLVMVLMALDHTRDFFGIPGSNPVDIQTTTAALFLTRWVTHICAPTFFLLTGVGAGLLRTRRSAAETARFLIVRGLLLVVLELTLIRSVAYQWNLDYRTTFLLVIWALGWAMVFLGLLIRLPRFAIAAIGLAMILLHNLLDGVPPTTPLLAILHGPGFVLQGDHTVFAAYALIPWIGVTAVGYALASVYAWPSDQRRRTLIGLGVACVVAFIMLRAINRYGDPSHWAVQSSVVMTVVSFANATKYPPSLLFLLMTLGPALILLGAMEGRRLFRPVVTVGRVPFFYYVVHFALIHAAAAVTALVRYGSAHWMFESPSVAQYPFTAPPEWGYPLPVVYLVWAGVVLALYPACRRIAALKASGAYPWLSYF